MKNSHPLRRILAVLVAILLFTHPLFVQAGSSTATAITAQPVTAAPGENVTVLLKLENNPGMNALTLKVGYDSSALTLVSVTDKNLFGSKPTQSPKITANPYSIIWATAGNVTENGSLVELTFRVADTASGTQTLTLTATAFDENDNSVAVQTQNAVITVAGQQPSTASITAQPVTAAPGENVTVLLKLENNPGMNALTLKVGYDSSALTLVSVTDKNLFGGKPTQSPKLTANPYSIIWATAGNVTENGSLVELTFRVADTASGTQTLTLTATAFDENDNSVAVQTQNAVVSIGQAHDTKIERLSFGETIRATVFVQSDMAANALCVLYDASGKFLSVQIKPLTAGTSNELLFDGSPSAKTVKLFVLETATAAPVCASAEQTAQ